MQIAIYKRGGKTRVWNTTAHLLVIDDSELEQYQADGWVDHPSKLDEQPKEPEDDLIGDVPAEKPKNKAKK